MNVLVLAEHNNKRLSPLILNTLTAALQLGDTSVLVAGQDAYAVAEEARLIKGVKEVLLVQAAHYEHGLAEELAPLLVKLGKNYDYILSPASSFGKNVLPRVAALLDCPQISEVTEIIDSKTFIHPIYAGNAFETVAIATLPAVLTIRTTAFNEAARSSDEAAPIEMIEATEPVHLSSWVGEDVQQSERLELTQAKVVVSGGRALGSAQAFQELLAPLAEKLQAAIGASRAAVDAGYAPNDAQVGQTGKIVAPDLYIAVGISGAIQHLAGMQDSKVIVAINKDPDAPIFKVADYGLVEDIFTAVPELIAKL